MTDEPVARRRRSGAGLLLTAVLLASAVLGAIPATGRAAVTVKRLALVFPLVANTAGLEHFASEVSTPGSRFYGDYASIPQLAERFGASAAERAKAITYLRAHGATAVHSDATGLFIDATLPTATAERLFGTDEREVRSARGDYAVPRSTVQIPAALSGIVSGVVGLDTEPIAAAPALERRESGGNPFSSVSAPILSAAPAPTAAAAAGASSAAATAGSGASASSAAATAGSAARLHGAAERGDTAGLSERSDAGTGTAYAPASGTPSGCAAAQQARGFTPNQYLDAYNFNSVQDGGSTIGQGETVALVEIDGYIASDVKTFAACFGLHLPKIVGFSVGSGVGASGLVPGGESDLDLEVLTAAAPGLKGIDVYETESDASSVLTALTAPLQNTGYEPQVISASLGLCEAQTLEAVGKAGIKDTEAALAEASAAGISFLAASGDDGSADCLPDNTDSSVPLPQLAVNYPASSAWATGVGGTNLGLNTANQIVAQDAWNDGNQIPGQIGATGGGVSAVIPHPAYQTGVVTSAFRAVPDVALLADVAPGFDVYCTADLNISTDGCYDPDAPEDCSATSVEPNCPWQPFGGTSAATPLLAGGVALIDQLLRERNRQSLGLLNPLLYALGKNPANDAGSVFYDVPAGSSNDVGPYISGFARPLGCCSTAAGYDEATGWGGVDLDGLAHAALASQPAIPDVAEAVPSGQRPLFKAELVDRVTCAGHCRMGSFAVITIAGHKPLTIFSGLYTLAKAGSKNTGIHFSKAILNEFLLARAHGKVISARVYGAIVDPAGNVERQTGAIKLRIIT